MERGFDDHSAQVIIEMAFWLGVGERSLGAACGSITKFVGVCMDVLTVILKTLSWWVFLLGLYVDLFSLYCCVRVVINPCFRRSSVPFLALVLYCMAEGLGFPNKRVLLFLCCLDILLLLLSILVRFKNPCGKVSKKDVREADTSSKTQQR